MNNNNGFLTAIDQLSTKLNVNQDVTDKALKKAAEYFVKQMKPNIPKSELSKTHLRDMVKVRKVGDDYAVVFDEKAWYWSMVDKGHKKRGGKGKVKGAFFVQKTLTTEEKKLTEMLIDGVLKN